MIDHLQRGLWDAWRKIIAVGIVLVILLVLIVVVAGFAVLRTAAGTEEQTVLGGSVPINGKIQAITESITCIAEQCPEADGAAAFLDTIVAPSATYTIDTESSQALSPGSARWRDAALAITGNGTIEGTATGIEAEGMLADFNWDGTQWAAEFVAQGDTQQLASLTKKVP